MRGSRVAPLDGRAARAKRGRVARRLVRATAHREGEARLRARRCAARWFGFPTWFWLDNCWVRLLSGWPVFPDVASWSGSGGLSTQSPRHTPLSVRSPGSSGYLAPYRRRCRHSYTRVCRVHTAQLRFSFPGPLQYTQLQIRYRKPKFRPLYANSPGRRGRGAPALGIAARGVGTMRRGCGGLR